MTDTAQHPPLDVELAETVWPAIVNAGLGIGMTHDQIPHMRQAYVARLPTTDALRREGSVDIEERFIPGPHGAPDLPALILRPLGSSGPLPCIYYTANGGKIIRSTRVALSAL